MSMDKAREARARKGVRRFGYNLHKYWVQMYRRDLFMLCDETNCIFVKDQTLDDIEASLSEWREQERQEHPANAVA